MLQQTAQGRHALRGFCSGGVWKRAGQAWREAGRVEEEQGPHQHRGHTACLFSPTCSWLLAMLSLQGTQHHTQLHPTSKSPSPLLPQACGQCQPDWASSHGRGKWPVWLWRQQHQPWRRRRQQRRRRQRWHDAPRQQQPAQFAAFQCWRGGGRVRQRHPYGSIRAMGGDGDGAAYADG